MNVSSLGHRIAPGWYKAEGQLVLTMFVGRGHDREAVWSRIVPRGCTFRVRPADAAGPRDCWQEVAAYQGQTSYQKIDGPPKRFTYQKPPRPTGRPGEWLFNFDVFDR